MTQRLLVFLLIIISFATIGAAKPTDNVMAAKVVWTGDKTRPQVALTFDDGPKPEYSIPILNILDQFGVKATFFVIGREARWHPDLIYRIVDSGHDIANHTYSHYRLDSLSRKQIDEEFAATNDIIKSVTGKTPIYARPPGGRFNRVVLEEAYKYGLTIIGWSVNAGDYTTTSKYFRDTKKAEEIVSRIVGSCHDGDIILMHNGGGPTAQALPQIIMSLRKKGFELVTISELLKKNPPNIFAAKKN